MPHFDILQIAQIAGYPGIAAAIFLESGVVVGFFLPGGSLLFTAGLLAGTGLFNIWILVPLVTIAAILGDNAGYWFGSKVGKGLFQREDARFFKKRYVDETREFFEKYGKGTIVLARFFPIVRTFAPILAGVGSMEYRLFFFYNALGAILWGAGIVLMGYLLGSSLPNAQDYLLPIVVGILVVTTLPVIIKWLLSKKKTPRAVIFDLDNTLAESFKPPTPHVVEKLKKLLTLVPVGIMSGASFERMAKDVLPVLPADTDKTQLYLFPDTGAQCFMWERGAWQSVYKNAFTKGEYEHIVKTIEEGLIATKILEGAPRFGDLFLARDTQITLAAIGVDASAEAKAAWDQDRSKRAKLKVYLDKELAGFDVRISGRTAIDVTRTGIDKAYGVRWLAKHLSTKPTDLLFVGDDLKPGGNDAVVIPTGIRTREVEGPEAVAGVIDEILATFAQPNVKV